MAATSTKTVWCHGTGVSPGMPTTDSAVPATPSRQRAAISVPLGHELQKWRRSLAETIEKSAK